ncbi:MAG: hypothetical protein BJ554DRAFT_97, partial [Olpidium bornovanus]
LGWFPLAGTPLDSAAVHGSRGSHLLAERDRRARCTIDRRAPSDWISLGVRQCSPVVQITCANDREKPV